jgi:hypothetical protein
MKKLIAALILATSFAALADDAAKAKEPAKTEKKADTKHDAKHDTAAKPAPAAEKPAADKK